MNKVAEFVGIPYLNRLISNQSEQPELANSPTRSTSQHFETSPPPGNFAALENLATSQAFRSTFKPRHLPALALTPPRSCWTRSSQQINRTLQQRTLKPRKEHTLKSLKAMRGGRRPPNPGPPRARKSPRASHSRASLSLPSLPFPSLAGPPEPSRGSPSSPDLFHPHPILIEPNPSLSNPLQASPSHSKPLQT